MTSNEWQDIFFISIDCNMTLVLEVLFPMIFPIGIFFKVFIKALQAMSQTIVNYCE